MVVVVSGHYIITIHFTEHVNYIPNQSEAVPKTLEKNQPYMKFSKCINFGVGGKETKTVAPYEVPADQCSAYL